MTHPVVLRVVKHRTTRSLEGIGRHQWREIPTPNAVVERTPLNEDWRPVHGSADLVAAVEARIADRVTEKVPDRSVLALEYVITANAQAFREGGGHVDSTAYFRDALAWLERKHGADNVVAVNIQRDEIAPHMVAFVVPVVDLEAKTRKRSVIVGTNPDGTKRRETRIEHQDAGARLSASHFVDGPAKLAAMQTEFAEQVGQKHGLKRGVERSGARHQTTREYQARMAQVPERSDVELPEPTMADRLNPRAYAAKVIERAEPRRVALEARAATADMAERRAKEMTKTAERAQAELAELREFAAPFLAAKAVSLKLFEQLRDHAVKQVEAIRLHRAQAKQQAAALRAEKKPAPTRGPER